MLLVYICLGALCTARVMAAHQLRLCLRRGMGVCELLSGSGECGRWADDQLVVKP